jgi:hypothetical protein
MYDMRELHRKFLKTAGLEDVDTILPDVSDIPVYDPISENARMMSGGPVKVFSYQDHDSHISAHMSLMQNPQIAQNPNAKVIQASVSSHISEHMAHKYRNEAEQLMQMPIAPLDNKDGKGISEEQEQQIATAAAQAAAQITGKAQQQATLEQQMAAAQDPVMQQQQAELQIEQAKVQQDAQEAQLKSQTELQKAQMRTTLEEKRLAQQRESNTIKIQADLLKGRSR